MNHLQELGIDTSKASMCWIKWGENTTLSVHDEYCYEPSLMNPIPTFTLQDILEMLPKDICQEGCTWSAALYIDYESNRIAYGNTDREGFEIFHEVEIVNNNLLDTAYEMLCWCIENGYRDKEE